MPIETQSDITVEGVLEKIYSALSTYSGNSMSLMEGLPGVVLFMHYYGQQFPSAAVASQFDRLMDQLIDTLNDTDIASLTYCDGLTGVLTLLLHLSQEKGQTYYDVDPDIDAHLATVMLDNLSRQEYDFLHGGLGIFHYLLQRYRHAPDEMLRTCLANALQLLEANAVKDAQGYRWRTFIHHDPQYSGMTVYNTGLAHGQACVLLVAGGNGLLSG